MAILTNLLIFLVALYYYLNLKTIKGKYAEQTAKFVLLIGIATCVSALAHGMQLQMGENIFRIILFVSHLFNLTALYFCFKAAYTYQLQNKGENKLISFGAIVITCSLIIFSILTRSFLIIKIPAGIVLSYSLIVHFIGIKNKDKGSGIFVAGILIAFLSILVHTLRISFHQWFNHKDIAHIIIVVSLVFMCKGVKLISEFQNSESVSAS